MLHTLFQWIVKITGYIPHVIMTRTKIYYEDRSVQKRHINSKAIVICNHNHLLDFAVLLFVFWTRTLRCAVAEVMYSKNFFMTSLLKLLGCVTVDRENFDFSFLSRLQKILDKGGVVEIYPEARLPRKGEELPLEFKPSYVYLALESGAPVIPLYSNGRILSKERQKIIIGKPIDVLSMYDSSLSEKENISRINDYIRNKVIELGKQLDEQSKNK